MSANTLDQYGSTPQQVSHHVSNLPSTGLDVWPLVGLAVLFIIIGFVTLMLLFRGVRS